MLSVIVITKNEEKFLAACLESVKWADEIIIADNGSTDKTLEIARKYTSHIFTETDHDFANLRNKAMEKAKGDWVLYIDADERVMAPLREEIKALINSETFVAYALSRQNIIFGQAVSYGPYARDWMIRLLKKSAFKQWIGRVHEHAQFTGELGYSAHSLLHLTHRDVDSFVLKSLEYSKIDAKLRLDAHHPAMSGWRFMRILVTEIWNQGFNRRGFFGGTVGVVDSMLQAFSMFITYVRLWQLQQKPLIDQKYEQIDEQLVKTNFETWTNGK